MTQKLFDAKTEELFCFFNALICDVYRVLVCDEYTLLRFYKFDFSKFSLNFFSLNFSVNLLQLHLKISISPAHIYLFKESTMKNECGKYIQS